MTTSIGNVLGQGPCGVEMSNLRVRPQKSDDEDDPERWTWPVIWKLPLGSLGVFHRLIQ